MRQVLTDNSIWLQANRVEDVSKSDLNRSNSHKRMQNIIKNALVVRSNNMDDIKAFSI